MINSEELIQPVLGAHLKKFLINILYVLKTILYQVY